MNRTIVLAPVRKSVVVNVSPARAFEVFTKDISRWWPPTHTTLTVAMKQAIIEPHSGGRWYQIGVDGSEADTGHVLAWEPPSRVVLSWELDANFKCNPDAASEVEISFIAEGPSATRVELEHRHIERMGEGADKARAMVDAPGGWGTMLQRFAEVASA